jgi:hypothetical protein
MPDGIGKTCEHHEMDFDVVRQGIAFLRTAGYDTDKNSQILETVKQQ